MRHLRYPPEGKYQEVIIFVKEIELSSSIEWVAFHHVFCTLGEKRQKCSPDISNDLCARKRYFSEGNPMKYFLS